MPNSNLSGGLFMTNTDGTKLEIPSDALKSFYHGVLSNDAESQMNASQYDAAIDTLNQAVVALIDDAATLIPLSSKEGGGMQSSVYQNMTAERLIRIMRCCAHYVECYYKKVDYVRALDWASEMHAIFRNMLFVQPAPMFEWMNTWYPDRNWWVARTTSYQLEIDTYMALGNTGTAAHHCWLGLQKTLRGLDMLGSRVDAFRAEIEAPFKEGPNAAANLMCFYHPDPKLVVKQNIKDPRLQVMGSWQKVQNILNTLEPRQGFSSFVWNRRFYVFGGRKTVISNRWATDEVRLTPGLRRAVDKGQRLYRDFHYIDLADLAAGWKQLPAYPTPVNRSYTHLGNFGMEVDHADHKAYFFHGRPVLDVFDLRTNRWSQITTKMARGSGGPWPLKPGYAEFCMTIVKRKLYVFGGTLPDWSLGGNLLMALDLTMRKWTRLSGEPDKNVQPNLKVPGPRTQAMMWVDRAEERLWVMYGEADRPGAKQMREMKFAADESHVHNDCWSWGIATKEWRQERIAGNAPCPRSEAGIVHNTKLNKVIMFGGFNSAMPTSRDTHNTMYTYYADTFMLDTEPEDDSAPSWRQVITRGWPTYRTQCKLFTDPETGKVYLFGGHADQVFIHGRKDTVTRSYADLWQLRINIPGGFYEDVDLEEESRSAKAGPWKRCLSCGNAGPGAGVKECRGTCGGKAVFCDTECERQGWEAHKEKDGCTKRA